MWLIFISVNIYKKFNKKINNGYSTARRQINMIKRSLDLMTADPFFL